MARPRKPGNRDMVRNLCRFRRPDGRYYYEYRDPKGGKKHGFGYDKAAAEAAATELNRARYQSIDLVQKVMTGGSSPISFETLVNEYIEKRVPDKAWADKTLKNMKGYLRRYQNEWGARLLEDMTTLDISTWLDALPGTAYIKHRALLIDLFVYARAKGYITENPAEITLTKKAGKKKRQRMTLEQYKAIYEMAPIWLQNAMDLSLITLQRRGDIVEMRFDEIRENKLHVIQNKTKDKSDKAFLAIAISLALAGVIKRCRASGVVSPFLVHYRPEHRSREELEAKEHWTQVREEYLTRAFEKARDATGLFKDWEPGIAPGFHEIRSLGGHLYEKAGYDKGYIQSLMGHTSSKMTQHYLNGHEIQFHAVAANLVPDHLAS